MKELGPCEFPPERIKDTSDLLAAYAEIERLRAALQWYADAGDYDKAVDCGRRAKEALGVNEQKTICAPHEWEQRWDGIRCTKCGTKDR